MIGRAWIAWFGLLALLPGCASPAAQIQGESVDDSSDPLAPQARVDAERGGLVGSVTDDSLLPIGNATVVVDGLGLVTSTDFAGRFAFSLLAPGPVRILVSHPAYEELWREVEIVAGEPAELQAVLVPLPSSLPYHTLREGNGRIMCSVAARPGLGVGVCAIAQTAAGGLGEEPRVDIELSATNFSTIRTLVLETQWQPAQLGAGGLHVTWEHAQDWNQLSSGPERRIILGQVNGDSPLHLRLEQTDMAPLFEDAAPMKYCAYFGPCTLSGIGYAHASTAGASSPADGGAYVDQPFRHFVSEFFVEPAPADYTAVVDG
jgi:hypothetical protein